MQSEQFLVCALPHSARADSDVHVSLFVAPKLTPSAPQEPLGEFPTFRDWGKHVKRGARVELYDQNGPIECEPLLDPVDPPLWRKLFGKATPVLGQEVPRWDDRSWRSFDSRTVATLAKAVHLVTMYADPTSPPAPRNHPLTRPLIQSLGEILTRGHQGRGRYDESQVTEWLDEIVEGAPLERWADQPPTFGLHDGLEGLVERMAVELHRVRRFYERPESQGHYHERPDPKAETTRPEAPEPEFHERCTMAGDHPELLRKLGLVVDLRADTARLAKSQWLTARITVPGDATCRTTRVRCAQAADGALFTPASGSDWNQGALALGDEDRFAVLDVDTDGSAIKTERFLWTIPRLLQVEQNGDPVHAATPALRAGGFTIARTGQALSTKQQLDRQAALEADLAGGTESTLLAEDVTRGLRVEVWDDHVQRWFSLHSRLTDVLVKGHGKVLDDLAEEGFIQGTTAHETPGVADSPIHVHEAMFGWEGWSLSAPRPGKRIRNDGADEVVEDTPANALTGEKPPHPITFTHEAKQGTLPRLRFGRSYAFRAWSVDLAGNSRPHGLNPAPTAPVPEVESALSAAAGPSSLEAAALWSRGLRQAAHEVLEARRMAPAPSVVAEEPPELLAELVTSRLRERRALRPALRTDVGAASRRALVNEVAARALADPAQPLVVDTAVTDTHALAALAVSHLAAQTVAGSVPGSVADLAVSSLATVTKLRPFLRWDPVQPPAPVARHRFTEGESLRVMVVRSGVTQDPETLAITVTDPATYASQAEAAHPGLGYAATSQRHLAPPKTSQVQAELHGKFDLAVGTATPQERRKMLAWAISEDGSFLDVDRADLTKPGKRIAQPGVRLEAQGDPPQAEPKTLPLPAGEPPAPGQYVVHDVDDLTLPYLPDPLARGVSLVFPEAGRDRTIAFPFGTEGFTARYGGSWPAKSPFRLVVEGADELGGDVAGRVIRLRLPAGDQQQAVLSSSLSRSDLDLLGVWRSLAPMVRSNHDVQEAAADGWLWGLTPSEEWRFVHAVPRPLEAPRPTMLRPLRNIAETAVALSGAVDVHGPSTDRLIAEASWSDPVDDLNLDRWQQRDQRAIAFETPVTEDEDLAGLARNDQVFLWPGAGPFRVHQAVHQLGDTKHRMVSYQFRATTRFREYFHPDLLRPSHDGDDGRSVVGAPTVVDVPSSARPAAPVVHSVIPLFRWDLGPEAEQPMGRRHSRRAGVRIYLERPWFSSGEGELLGVLLAPLGAGDDFPPRAEGESGFPFVSKVGADPIWESAPVPQRAMNVLMLENVLRVVDLDDRPQPGRPVTGPASLPLTAVPGSPTVMVVGYQPQFNQTRGLWYVDVALDPGDAVWPFVRLAVARYQPSSVDGCHLSAPVRCDYVQLPPERALSVSRTDDSHVRVVLSGVVGLRDTPASGGHATPADLVGANRFVVARLQKRDPEINTDLGWQTVTTEQLTIRGTGRSAAEVAWVGELAAGVKVKLRTPSPSGPSTWRVTVEEWERFRGDPLSPLESGPVIAPIPTWEQRLVFADEVML